MNIGILALQGAFVEHKHMFEQVGVCTSEIRLPGQLSDINGLVIPGGESTTIMKLMESYQLVDAIRSLAARGIPIWGTCAGMVCLASQVNNPGTTSMQTISLMDITVRRNAFGRQVDSFETKLQIPCLPDGDFPGVFIRAPFIEKTGNGVKALCHLEGGEIVAARQDNLLVTSFHPELTTDARFHSYFSNIVKNNLRQPS